MIHYCQICAMPMFTRRDMGTNEDGTTSPDYCCSCYRGGRFTDERRAYNGLNTFSAPFATPLFQNGTGSAGFPQFMSPYFSDYMGYQEYDDKY